MGNRIFTALAENAKTQADQTAMRMDDTVLCWAELAARVAHLSAAVSGSARVVGINCTSPLAAALADLAITHAGRVSVHLPAFFSTEQKDHIIKAAHIDTIVSDGAPRAGCAHIAIKPLTQPADPSVLSHPKSGAKRIIFTSGSSGQPKGVVIGANQLSASLDALAQVISPQANDRHLSLLPMAQLLEQIAGLYLPIMCGVEIVFSASATPALFGGPIAPVVALMQQTHPTTTIVVPALLARLVAEFEKTSTKAPDSLRFVAVGGAHSAPALLSKAKACGLPVHAGYGLSECSSVVAMQRPGTHRPDTVGAPLPGIKVRIDDGEIVVSGPTVMEGYLGQADVKGEWRTGDLGRIDDGQLIIEGRKDWLIVTPAGRNISPEWVEARLCADPRIPAAGLHLETCGNLSIVAALTASVSPAEIAARLVDLPGYARPKWVVPVPADLPGLIRSGGGVDRSQLGAICASVPAQELLYETKEDA